MTTLQPTRSNRFVEIVNTIAFYILGAVAIVILFAIFVAGARAEYGDHTATNQVQRNDDGSYGSGNSFSAYTSMSPTDQKTLFDTMNAASRQMRFDNSFIGKVFNFFSPYRHQYPGKPYNQPRGAVCDCRGFGGWSW